MIVSEFIKTTSRDWEGHNACKIIVSECDLRCPYCNHQPMNDPMRSVNLQAIYDYIDSKLDFLTGIVISGGEPTCNPDLYIFLKEIKKRKLKVRLDTNGMHPDVIDDLIGAKLVDCVCMNIMAPLNKEDYSKTAGTPVDIEIIKRTINIIKTSKVNNIFKTVTVPGMITENNIASITKEIQFAKHFILIQYDPSLARDPAYQKLEPYSATKLREMGNIAKMFVKNVCVRDV